MSTPRQANIRHRVDPGDVPPEKAARRLGLTLTVFNEKLPNLLKRGFPPADPDTGNYDLDAIDLWRRNRNQHLFGLTKSGTGEQPLRIIAQGMGDRFAATKRGRHDPAA